MNIEEFKLLLAEGKDDEASELLKQFMAQSISPQEQGKALLEVLALDLAVKNTVDEEYLKVLKNAVTELQNLKSQENIFQEAIDLKKARKLIE